MNKSELSAHLSYPGELSIETDELSTHDHAGVLPFEVSHHRASLRGRQAIIQQEQGLSDDELEEL